MSKNLPNMLESTITKIKEMLDANSVVGQPIVVDGVTIIPISNISVGLGGGGSDYVSKHPNNQENPFGGGVGAGLKVTPVAFLIIKDGNVRMMPVANPATRERYSGMLRSPKIKLLEILQFLTILIWWEQIAVSYPKSGTRIALPKTSRACVKSVLATMISPGKTI